jgi:hypothetical protein
MKTIELNIYKFAELSENGKRKAIEGLSDIKVGSFYYKYIIDAIKFNSVKI